MSSNQRRGPWSPQEDQALMDLVHAQGALNWVKISSLLCTRTPKQCRERYHQNLKPELNREPISPEEGRLINDLVVNIGKRWAEIARRLHNRSDNAVKNWWNGSENRRKRSYRRKVHDDGHIPAYSRAAPAPLRLPVTYTQYHHALSPTATHYPHAQWGIHHAGLPSPSNTSPGTDSFRGDAPPSLMSDTGSYYSTSPTIPGHPESPHERSPLDLPPLRLSSEGSPRCDQYGRSPRLPSLIRHDAPTDPFRRHGGIMEPGHQTVTAPSSPVGVWGPTATSPGMMSHGSPRGEEFCSKDQDARMNVHRLLSA